jgi:hypothetical protein
MTTNNLKRLLLKKKPSPVFKKPIKPVIKDISGGLKKVLLIGINYIECPENTLNGCINDVKNIKGLLNKFYPNCTQFKVLTDYSTNPSLKPTIKNIIDSINWLVKDLKKGDSVYFHYSGHGGLTLDLNKDETSGNDSCIYPICNGEVEMITDDELKTFRYTQNQRRLELGTKKYRKIIHKVNSETKIDDKTIKEIESTLSIVKSKTINYE